MAFQLVFIRMDARSKEDASAVLAKLDPLFPDSERMTNRELINLLTFLQSPTLAAKAAKLLSAPSAATGEEVEDSVLARNRGYGGAISQVIANRPDAQKIH